MLDFIITLLNSLFILRLSLLFTFLIGCVKLAYSLKRDNKFAQCLLNKVETMLSKSLNFSFIRRLCIISYAVTTFFFGLNKLFYVISVISGLSIGFSVIFRIFLLNGYTVYGQTCLLLFFLINALFRTIITLGLKLQNEFRYLNNAKDK